MRLRTLCTKTTPQSQTQVAVLSSGLSELQKLISIALIRCYKLVQGLSRVGLGECWRPMNPLNKEYSYNSLSHKCYSCIDYSLSSDAIVSQMNNPKIYPITISDHDPVIFNQIHEEAPTQ